jgi:NTE family protein
MLELPGAWASFDASATGYMMTSIPPLDTDGAISNVALILSGGNALGSFHGGVYEEMLIHGIQPQWIVGASVGAITGAILAGNPPERRLERLRQYWDEASQAGFWPIPPSSARLRELYNASHIFNATAFGRPGIYRHSFPGALSMLPWMPNDLSLYDQRPLRGTLERLVDFDLLNRADVRLSFICIDVETGEEVWFENTRGRIEPEHLLATVALMPVFQPIEIDGRLLCDPGLRNNLPVDHVLADPPTQDLICFASDLHSPRGKRPASLDAVYQRTEDIVFGSQGHRAIAALRREYALRQRWEPAGPSVTLVHFAYQALEPELAGKLFDFSPGSIRDRWTSGRREMERALAMLASQPRTGERFTYLARMP